MGALLAMSEVDCRLLTSGIIGLCPTEPPRRRREMR